MARCLKCHEETGETLRLSTGREVALCRPCRRKLMNRLMETFAQEVERDGMEPEFCLEHEILSVEDGSASCSRGRVHVAVGA